MPTNGCPLHHQKFNFQQGAESNRAKFEKCLASTSIRLPAQHAATRAHFSVMGTTSCCQKEPHPLQDIIKARLGKAFGCRGNMELSQNKFFLFFCVPPSVGQQMGKYCACFVSNFRHWLPKKAHDPYFTQSETRKRAWVDLGLRIFLVCLCLPFPGKLLLHGRSCYFLACEFPESCDFGWVDVQFVFA